MTMFGEGMDKERKTIEELYKELKSSPEGLSQTEASRRVLQYGLNSIGSKNRFVLIKNIVGQFSDFLVLILIIAAILSLILGDGRTANAMIAVVLLNAAIGFWQQYKTEKTMLALKELLPNRSTVLREGRQTDILSKLVVPGDVLILQAGDSVPADGQIIEGYSIKTNESSLTGESLPQEKHEHPDEKHPNANRVFMGTGVLEGEAKVLVTSVGINTQFGKIAKKTKETKEELSPLQKKLRQVGQTVAKIAGTIMILIIGYELIRNKLIDHKALEPNFFREIFLFALAVAAALVPEGLPAIVSVALSLGANRLVKKKAVVKKLASVETLGGTNVICTDKTGTLTVGKMSVVSVWTANAMKPTDYKQFNMEKSPKILANWALCHNVKLVEKKISGDSDEVALYEAVLTKDFDPKEFSHPDKGGYSRVRELSFNPIRKMMSVLMEKNHRFTLFSKGNPEVILGKCQLDNSLRNKYLEQVDLLAGAGLRVFAFAHRDFSSNPKSLVPNSLEEKLVFDGFCGIQDDIHPEVPSAISYCHKAGIKIIMITGDYRVTAEATAKKINLFQTGDFRMISGEELAKMPDLELRENLLHPVVFYQTDPLEKLRIVETLQNMGLVVAVTGDGVNDAMALKKADIGVAMGRVGTDVAKEAADMVLLDDNFATIVNAVREGRQIWDNLKKFLFYVFSSNAGEFMLVFFGLMFGLPAPIMAVQILSVDLGTDVLPSLALAADPAAKDILERRVERRENLLGMQIIWKLFRVGLIMGGGGALVFWLINGSAPAGTELYYTGTTGAFATLVVCQIVNVFEVRGGFRKFSEALLSNKYLLFSVIAEIAILVLVVYLAPLQNLLYTKPLSIYQWLPILGVGLVFLITEELRKVFKVENSIIVKKELAIKK